MNNDHRLLLLTEQAYKPYDGPNYKKNILIVRCCIRLSLTFILPPASPIRTLDIRRRL